MRALLVAIFIAGTMSYAHAYTSTECDMYCRGGSARCIPLRGQMQDALAPYSELIRAAQTKSDTNLLSICGRKIGFTGSELLLSGSTCVVRTNVTQISNTFELNFPSDIAARVQLDSNGSNELVFPQPSPAFRITADGDMTPWTDGFLEFLSSRGREILWSNGKACFSALVP